MQAVNKGAANISMKGTRPIGASARLNGGVRSATTALCRPSRPLVGVGGLGQVCLKNLPKATSEELSQVEESEMVQAQAPQDSVCLTVAGGAAAPTVQIVPLLMLLMVVLALVTVTLQASQKVFAVIGAVWRSTKALSPSKIVTTLQYQMLQGRSMPTLGKLWTLLGFCGFVVVQGAWAYKSAVGAPWPEALQKSYFTMNNVPGMDCTSDDTPQGTLVLNCIHIVSLFTFAILVGILTDDISRAVDYLRTGNFAVKEVDHTVMVGWNKQTIHTIHAILHRIDNTRNNDAYVFSRPIFILADRDKEEMDEELLEEFGEGLLGKVLQTRSGKAQDVADMERVSAGDARTIVWMHPNAEDEEGEEEGCVGVSWSTKLAASVAIVESLGRGKHNMQNLVVQSRESDAEWEGNIGLTTLLNSMKNGSTGRKYSVTRVSDAWGLTAFLAQCASQPGLADVFERLFIRESGNNPEVHIVNYPQMKGYRFEDARKSFAGATAVCGVVRSGMNPPDDLLLEEEDALILLTTDPKGGLLPTARPHQIFPLAPSPKHAREVRDRHYVLVSHNGNHSLMLGALKEALGQEANTRVTISVVTSAEPGEEEEEKEVGGLPIKFIYGNPNLTQNMLDADLERADSVLIDTMPGFPPDEADAQVLASVLQLQAILASSGKERTNRMTVICGVNSPQAREVLERVEGGDGPAGVGRTLHIDCIENDKLLGGILTQVAANPQLELVFQDLFDAEGQEVYAKPCGFYGLIDPVSKKSGPLDWSYLQEVVRREGDLLVGYVDKMENVRLAVPYAATVTLEEGDRLVVISEELY